MKSLWIQAAFLPLAIASFAEESPARAPAAVPAAVEWIFNSGMELGTPGEPVPNFFLRFYLDPAVALAPDAPEVFPVTVADGFSGQGLRVPAIRGMREYNLETERFQIEEDGEVEISFRVRSGLLPDGSEDPNARMIVDFRCYNRNIQYGSTSERYPVLETFSAPISTQWTTVSRRFRVRGGFPYSLWFRRNVMSVSGELTELNLDEVRVRPVGHPPAFPDELVARPDRRVPLYEQNEAPTFFVRALLNRPDAAVTLPMRIIDDEDSTLVRESSVALVRAAEPVGDDPRALFTGSVELPGIRFGSFSSRFLLKEERLAARGGDFAVIHPVVRHPRFSPGWSLGFNWPAPVSHQLAPLLAPSDQSAQHGARPMAEFMARSGAQTARIWGHWRMTEPEKDDFQADFMKARVALAREFGMDPLFLLGGTFTHAPPPERPIERKQGDQPAWLYQEHTVRPGVALPPIDRWEKYVEFCALQLKDQVDLWEVVNEASNGWTAEEYLPVLEAAYRILKKHQPESLVIGNGATGDLGLRPIGWTRDLAALGHERFLDAVAFHPYQAGLDSLGGSYFKYRDVIQGIRDALSEPRPLWNTECYYMQSATIRQAADGEGLADLAAGDLTRHYLESLLHGVVGSQAPYDGQFVKRRSTVPSPLVPNSLFVGVNTLSWLLRDIVRLERIEVGRLVYAGLFLDEAGLQGLGFVYDQRAAGSRMTLNRDAAARLEWFDLFGNPFDPGDGLDLHMRPVYCRGEPAAIREVLSTATFRAGQGLHLSAKAFHGGLALGARNLTGAPMNADLSLTPDAGLPDRIRFSFTRNEEA
ncbi:MAG: hypothetical protein U1E27_07655, partial [Kiritimatiellia bacterium]|nr:hypothetical protein [Kiritimatiellia bacterium]